MRPSRSSLQLSSSSCALMASSNGGCASRVCDGALRCQGAANFITSHSANRGLRGSGARRRQPCGGGCRRNDTDARPPCPNAVLSFKVNSRLNAVQDEDGAPQSRPSVSDLPPLRPPHANEQCLASLRSAQGLANLGSGHEPGETQCRPTRLLSTTCNSCSTTSSISSAMTTSRDLQTPPPMSSTPFWAKPGNSPKRCWHRSIASAIWKAASGTTTGA